MAGEYELTTYLTDDYQGAFIIKIQPETRTLALSYWTNRDAERLLDGLQIIKTTGSRRVNRSLARVVRFRFSEGVPTGYSRKGSMYLPWLRPEGFDTFSPGTVGEYLGRPIVVTGTIPEKLV